MGLRMWLRRREGRKVGCRNCAVVRLNRRKQRELRGTERVPHLSGPSTPVKYSLLAEAYGFHWSPLPSVVAISHHGLADGNGNQDIMPIPLTVNPRRLHVPRNKGVSIAA